MLQFRIYIAILTSLGTLAMRSLSILFKFRLSSLFNNCEHWVRFFSIILPKLKISDVHICWRSCKFRFHPFGLIEHGSSRSWIIAYCMRVMLLQLPFSFCLSFSCIPCLFQFQVFGQNKLFEILNSFRYYLCLILLILIIFVSLLWIKSLRLSRK